MEQKNDKTITVGDAVARELNYYYKTIRDSISVPSPKLSWACYDNKVNQDANLSCKYCRRHKENCDTIANTDKLDHIISSASLYGLYVSTGSLVGSQLSTSCPRLRKHGESLASLNFGSYLDVTHSIINPEAIDLIEQQKKAMETSASKEAKIKAKQFKLKIEEDNEHIEDFHPSVGETLIEETACKVGGGHPLLAPFETNNHINVLSRLSLSGGSIHTRGMNFKSDRNLKNTRGDIPVFSSRVECKCARTARKVFQEQQLAKKKNIIK